MHIMNQLNPEKIKAAIVYVDGWCEANFEDSTFVGMQVAIQYGDELVYSRGFGDADIESGRPVTNETVFRIASHSKTFTATAIMQLMEQGKLRLDDPVSQHVSWFRSTNDTRIEAVTIRQLLNHTGGLARDGVDTNFWQATREFPDETELQGYIRQAHLVYDSDEVLKYSNYGYAYLGCVVAAVSGISYAAYIQKYIINRLGLESVDTELSDSIKPQLATGYSAVKFRKSRRTYEHINTRGLAAATGFCATAKDMCRYFAAHFLGDTRLLSDISKRLMQHAYWMDDTKPGGYGLGMTYYPKDGWTLYGHSGGFPGFLSHTRFDRERRLVVNVLTNSEDSYPAKVCEKIINIINTFQQDNDHALPEDIDVRSFEGRFYAPRFYVDVVAVGSKLFAINSLGWTEFDEAQQLKVISPTELRVDKASYSNSRGEPVVYRFADDGSVDSVTYTGVTVVDRATAEARGWA